jgi:hypothetical protein
VAVATPPIGVRSTSASAEMTTTLYHSTTKEGAEAILRDGFRDQTRNYGLHYDTGEPFVLTGVWLSDRPLEVNEGTAGDTVLAVELHAPLEDLADCELIEEGKPYREWCVPAEIVHSIATVSIQE